MGSSSIRNRHRKLHHSCTGVTKGAMKYVVAEMKRMRLHNGGQWALLGFRVHSEFGWCARALQKIGYGLAPRRTGQWRKQRDLVQISVNQQKIGWKHIQNKGLRPDI